MPGLRNTGREVHRSMFSVREVSDDNTDFNPAYEPSCAMTVGAASDPDMDLVHPITRQTGRPHEVSPRCYRRRSLRARPNWFRTDVTYDWDFVLRNPEQKESEYGK
ncbi:MAG: hypothetical protein O3B95_01245 [Chloroflexi bacterium]|nr:hypothetical protein [Chloroflexota bacterium]